METFSHTLDGNRVELTNQLNRELRRLLNVDQRLDGSRTGKLVDTNGDPDDPKNQVWVFWHREHAETAEVKAANKEYETGGIKKGTAGVGETAEAKAARDRDIQRGQRYVYVDEPDRRGAR